MTKHYYATCGLCFGATMVDVFTGAPVPQWEGRRDVEDCPCCGGVGQVDVEYDTQYGRLTVLNGDGDLHDLYEGKALNEVELMLRFGLINKDDALDLIGYLREKEVA